MFTGIIEAACPVVGVTDASGSRRLAVDLAPLRSATGMLAGAATVLTRVGDSVAVNGCCLTVSAFDGERAAFDVVTETLQRTNLGALSVGGAVNVERSLRYGDPLDGHLVSGHIEQTGVVADVAVRPGDVRLTIACGADFARRTLPKGSVAVDGVSLTVAELHADTLVVVLVPHTLQRTTLALVKAGDRVNLEPDMLGQWVLRALAAQSR